MGIDDICGFGFMDAPKPERVRYSLERLKDLGAIDSRHNMHLKYFFSKISRFNR